MEVPAKRHNLFPMSVAQTKCYGNSKVIVFLDATDTMFLHVPAQTGSSP